MRKVEAAAEQTAHVPPEVVWSLLSDVMVYPRWGPWRKAGYQSEGGAAAHGKGSVYWLEGSKRYGFRYPVSVEEILDVEPGKRLAYTVLRGIPVRNYRAEVTLTPSPDGTLIRWGASWDRTIMGRLVYPSLRNATPQPATRCLHGKQARRQLRPPLMILSTGCSAGSGRSSVPAGSAARQLVRASSSDTRASSLRIRWRSAVISVPVPGALRSLILVPPRPLTCVIDSLTGRMVHIVPGEAGCPGSAVERHGLAGRVTTAAQPGSRDGPMSRLP
jgi:uncharacterized protein YndB with AHSA1/START domain